MIKDEVCNNMFTINISDVFPLEHVLRKKPWRPLCHPQPAGPWAVLPGCPRELWGRGERQLSLLGKPAWPGRKQKGPGEREGIERKTAATTFGLE